MPAFTDWLRHRFFRRLLGAYPEEFRDEYGAEMQADFDQRQRREPLARLVWDVFQDTLRTAPKEHFAVMLQDVRYALRGFAAQPGFTAVAVLSLAIGIGANCTIFSVSDALILRPAPVPEPYGFWNVRAVKQGNQFLEEMSYPDFLDLRAKLRSFESITGSRYASLSFAARREDLPQVQFSSYVSANFLEATRVQPLLGRGFRPEEDAVPGRDFVALVSHDAWVNLFHSDPAILGRRIRLNNQELTVIGITPASFTGLENFVRPAFYVPLMLAPALDPVHNQDLLTRRDRFGIQVRGRLKSGVARSTAEAELATFGRNLAAAYPASHATRGLTMASEFERRVLQSPPDAYLVAMLMSIVALVLLIACANVANLLLARGRARAREVAVRLAIGANRGRLFRQLFTESLLLAMLGCAGGLGLGYLGIRAFATLQPPGDIPLHFDIALDRRVMVFSLTVSFLSAVVFGVVPALRSLRPNLVGALKAGELEDTGRRRWFGRSALVAGQLALACVLLVVAAMMVNGVRGSLFQEPGFRRANILTAMAAPGVAGYSEPQSRQFFEQWLLRSRQLPGVRQAALTSALPTANAGFDFTAVVPEGFRFRPNETHAEIFTTTVSDGYFDVFEIPILKGRAFARTDTADKPLVAVVNEVFAERFWPNQEAIGRRFREQGDSRRTYEVVGVAKRARYLFISEAPMPAIYLAVAQRNQRELKLVVRTQGDPLAAVTPVRETVRALDANLPLQNVRTMEDYHDKRTVSIVNLLVRTVSTLGLCGLLLALIGLYGVMAYSVSRRTREIGIRLAIGAGQGGIVAMVLRQGGRIAALGTAIGLIIALAAARLLESGLLGLGQAHPLVFVIVPLLLMTAAAAACYVPARRAARIEPTRALRCE